MRFPVFRTSRRTPKPETPLRALPTATGRFRRTATGHGRYTVNQPARKPVLLLDAQQRAARLRKPRGPHLTRGQLHIRPGHHHRDRAILATMRAYVADRSPLPQLDLTPHERSIVQYAVRRDRPEIPTHKWDHHLRLNDIADHYGLDRGDNNR